MTLQLEIEALVRKLEAERGGPIQIQIDTPESAGNYETDTNSGGRMYVGSFEERAVKVQRVENMNLRYEHDVALLEGAYSSFKAFKEKFQALSAVVLSGLPYYEEDMVTEHFRRYIGEDVSGLVWDVDEVNEPQLKVDILFSLLDKHHVQYITFPFEISPKGIYNDWMRTLGVREISVDGLKRVTGDTDSSVKVANIYFERL